MESIKTQDCYLPINEDSNYSVHFWNGEEWCFDKKVEYCRMIVLTIKDFEKIIGDAFDAGEKYGINKVLQLAGKLTNKTEYLNSIIK